MTAKTIDVLGIGNAIVDVLAYHEEAFLTEQGLAKGGMTLVDEAEGTALYHAMGATTECSGGSAANTLAGIAMLGGKAAFIGKVKDDQLGEIFSRDLNQCGVSFNTPMALSGPSTARCCIVVTEEESPFGNPPKVERTMATFLGASVTVGKDDINPELIKQSKVLYLEGYLWDSPSAKEAIHESITIAKEHNTKVAFSLSDGFCVERHHEEFLQLIKNDVDILFANEHEIEALVGESDIGKILYHMNGICDVVAVTRSEKGSYILHDGEIHSVDPIKVESVFDVTGAGDLYAAGFLYGFTNDMGLDKAGKLGSLCAAEVIKYLGARPVTKLQSLLQSA